VSPVPRAPRILVVGDVMTDIIVQPEGPIVHGSDRRALIRSRPGGSGANQAVWLGSMGANVQFVARVGHADRDMYRNYFSGFGVDARLAADDTLPSGVLVTMLSPDGERSFLTDRGANLNLCRQDLPATLLDDIAVVMVSGYSFFADGPRQAVISLFADAVARGTRVAIDPASVGFLREVGCANFLTWTQGASIIFANESEAEVLTGAIELEEQMRVLGVHYDRVVIKLGQHGAALGDRNGLSLRLPAPPVVALDTTGAGDAFAAAFLSAELGNMEPEACLRAGIAAGSAAVEYVGGQPAL
jgi:sugar/nucleoside kinase (ribokinase family)